MSPVIVDVTEAAFNPESLSDFPVSPGVYIMKNASGEILYVGKAANLRNRVRNYFTSSGDNRFSVQFLRRQVAQVECVVTNNEAEAFILENTLIKQHQPRYNIRLRDDKTYISLRLRMDHEFPRLEVVRVRRHSDLRRREKDLYFGPYTNPGAVREVLRFLLKVFPVRTCKDSVFRNRTRPCLLYDVGKCCGPCVLPVPREEYDRLVRNVALFLRGRNEEVRSALEERMCQFSERMEYEKAAMVRDRIAALDETLEKQQAAVHGRFDRDAVGVASQQGRSVVVLQKYRSGLLTDTREYYVKNYEQTHDEVLYSFVSQHYADGSDVPEEIFVSEEPCDRAFLQDWLRQQRGATVALEVPQRGDRLRAVQTAALNAREALLRRLAGENTQDEILNEVAAKLDLLSPPHVIECVDISNIMGVMAVGSLVRFDNAQPDKAGYRLFKIRSVEGSNDFAMMNEVLQRRFRGTATEGGAAPEPRDPPDLLLVDGGKGQLSVAMQVMRELGIEGVALAAIAKSRLKVKPSRSGRTDPTAETVDHVRYRTDERIFLPGRKNPVTFSANSPALFLLQRVRDEAHRFGITYHRKLRKMANQRSLLDEVPGVGPSRKRLLLRHFGSLAVLRAASIEDIAAIDGISRAAAENVYSFLHPPARTAGPVTVEEDPDAATGIELEDSHEDLAGE